MLTIRRIRTVRRQRVELRWSARRSLRALEQNNMATRAEAMQGMSRGGDMRNALESY